MKTNLIIVEGLPGSGKSTTAAMIADELHKKGKKVICIDEGVREHPADYADYDFPDFETERVKILEKWRLFAEKFDRDTIYVFNCIFLQNPMCETMMIFGMDYAESQNYISEISKMLDADLVRKIIKEPLYLRFSDKKINDMERLEFEEDYRNADCTYVKFWRKLSGSYSYV